MDGLRTGRVASAGEEEEARGAEARLGGGRLMAGGAHEAREGVQEGAGEAFQAIQASREQCQG